MALKVFTNQKTVVRQSLPSTHAFPEFCTLRPLMHLTEYNLVHGRQFQLCGTAANERHKDQFLTATVQTR